MGSLFLLEKYMRTTNNVCEDTNCCDWVINDRDQMDLLKPNKAGSYICADCVKSLSKNPASDTSFGKHPAKAKTARKKKE